MKAEKVLGIAACAFACATGSAFASTTNAWFSATASGTDVTLTNVTTNDVVVTVAESKIKFEDVESSAPFTFTPGNDASATNKSDGIVVISATADLTPCMTNALATTEVTGAAAGFAVGVDDDNAANTNFYGYANGAWERLAGVAPAYEGANTAFKIIINYRDSKVSFSVGGTDLHSATNNDLTAFAIDSGKTALNNVAAFGSGAIASLSAGCEEAVVAVGTKKYGSVADAIVAGGSDSTIKNVDESGNISASTIAANGLSMAVCNALGLSVTEENTPAVKIVPVGSDTSANAITLCLDSSVEVEPGVAVKFEVRDGDTVVTGSPFASDAIQIPLEGLTGSKRYIIKPASVSTASGN